MMMMITVVRLLLARMIPHDKAQHISDYHKHFAGLIAPYTHVNTHFNLMMVMVVVIMMMI